MAKGPLPALWRRNNTSHPHSWQRSFLSFRLQGYFTLPEVRAEGSRLHGRQRILPFWKLSKQSMVPFNSMNVLQTKEAAYLTPIVRYAQSGAKRRMNWLRV